MNKNILVLKNNTGMEVDDKLQTWQKGSLVNIDSSDSEVGFALVTLLEFPYPSSQLLKEIFTEHTCREMEDQEIILAEKVFKSYIEFHEEADETDDDSKILILEEDYQTPILRDESFKKGTFVYTEDWTSESTAPKNTTRLVFLIKGFPELFINKVNKIPKLRKLIGSNEVSAGAFNYTKYVGYLETLSDAEESITEESDKKPLFDEDALHNVATQEKIFLALCGNPKIIIMANGHVDAHLTARGIISITEKLIKRFS